MAIIPKKSVGRPATDPILTRMAQEDKVPWYKKPNLRILYFLLFPTCMGVEMTSGFDSQIINAVQLVDPWQECLSHCPVSQGLMNVLTGFLPRLREPPGLIAGDYRRCVFTRSYLRSAFYTFGQ